VTYRITFTNTGEARDNILIRDVFTPSDSRLVSYSYSTPIVVDHEPATGTSCDLVSLGSCGGAFGSQFEW